jgi:hypothetical protein
MVGVEFITRRIAPLQNHRRNIWVHQGGDDIRLHFNELNTDAREDVIRAFFSSALIPTIPHGALSIYILGTRETSRITAGILKFNDWGPFLMDSVTPGPPLSAPAASSVQDLAARGAGPEASGDPDGDGAESGEWATRLGCSQSTVELSDSSDDNEAASADHPTGGDATASSSRDLEEEERLARLEAEHCSKFNAERASPWPESEIPHSKGWPASPLRPRHQPQPFRAREAGSSTTPREYTCN